VAPAPRTRAVAVADEAGARPQSSLEPEQEQGDAQPGAEEAPAAEPRNALTGQLLTRYRGRFTGDDHDQDLYETVDLAYADPEQRFSGSLLARGALDLDGHEDGGDEFFGLLDESQLYHAYLDVASRGFELLRFGRQPLYETPVTVLFDGVRAELAPRGERRVALGAYAGLGEHPYEASKSGDLVLGGFGALRAWEGAELRGDWMHLEDERLGVDHEDDLFGLALSQDVLARESATRMEARFTSLEGNGRDLRLLASHADTSWSLQGSLYQLLHTQKQLAAPLDPFSDTLFELFPYTQVGLSATKDWSHLALLSGADVRRVTDPDDEGDFNRDFERYYVTGTLPDALPVSISLTGEVWRATDTDYDTWGAALQRALEGGWDVSLGSYYALYEYDLFTAEERDHVRNYYVDLRWKKSARQHWALRYEFEHNDFDDYQQVRLDYAWSF
jgi:hypothetical protein